MYSPTEVTSKHHCSPYTQVKQGHFPGTTNVVTDLLATVPVIVPSAPRLAAPGTFSQFRLLSDTYASTVVPSGISVPVPVILTLTLIADPDELIAMTAILPSSFLNAAVLNPLGNPAVLTRTAPGRTYRDQLASAQSRLETT